MALNTSQQAPTTPAAPAREPTLLMPTPTVLMPAGEPSPGPGNPIIAVNVGLVHRPGRRWRRRR